MNTLNSLGEVTIKTALEKKGVDVSDLKFVEVPFRFRVVAAKDTVRARDTTVVRPPR